MSKRNLILVAIILVVVAVAAQLTTRTTNKKADEKIGQPILSADLVEAFDELLINGENGSVSLEKSGENWLVKEKDGYPADMKKMLELVDELTRFTVASLVTKDEKRLEHFQVIYRDISDGKGSKEGNQLVLKNQGKEIFRVIAGKKRESKSARADMPSYSDGSYIRIGASNTVYLTKDTVTFESDVKEWLQTSLFKTDKKEVQSIQFEVSGERFKLERAEKGKDLLVADLNDKEKTKDYERNSLLSDLEDFQVDEVIDKSSINTGDMELKSVVTFSLYDKKPVSFQVFRKEVEDPTKPKDEEKEYTYFLDFQSDATLATDPQWASLNELSGKWLFKMDEWKAKRWFNSRNDFVEEK